MDVLRTPDSRFENLMGIDRRVLDGVSFPARDADYRAAGR